MELKKWLVAWETNNIPFHRTEINPDLIKYFDQLNLQKHEPLFIPLCGKSQDILWIANQGYSVVGIEISPIACEDFFLEQSIKPEVIKETHLVRYRHQNIELVCADFFAVEPEFLPKFKAVYDWKALIALPCLLREKYIKHLLKFLDHEAKILLSTIESNDTVEGPPYPLRKGEVSALYDSNFSEINVLDRVDKSEQMSQKYRDKGFVELIRGCYLMSGFLLAPTLKDMHNA